ncbi:unnamed protein product [Porites evermanni]|uniref:Uncharacterized protein n=1 Tax=Porites evermanni TaxID=104178 RepID=A0ABN8MIH8_9CNID|nr:unnamed protein product [Porites evermanni]
MAPSVSRCMGPSVPKCMGSSAPECIGPTVPSIWTILYGTICAQAIIIVSTFVVVVLVYSINVGPLASTRSKFCVCVVDTYGYGGLKGIETSEHVSFAAFVRKPSARITNVR